MIRLDNFIVNILEEKLFREERKRSTGGDIWLTGDRCGGNDELKRETFLIASNKAWPLGDKIMLYFDLKFLFW